MIIFDMQFQPVADVADDSENPRRKIIVVEKKMNESFILFFFFFSKLHKGTDTLLFEEKMKKKIEI